MHVASSVGRRELRRVVPALVGGVVALSAGLALAAPPPPPPDSRPSSSPPPGATRQERERSSDGGQGQGGTPVIDQRTTDTDLTTNWGYSESKTEVKPNYVRSTRDTELTVNPIGYYQGVSVEGVNLPPYTAPELGVQPTVLTWTGFERGPNSSRAFFQLSSGLAYQVDRQGLIISIRLPNTSVSVRNNARRLDTSYFRTPLTELRIRREGRDVVLTMQLRREAAPTIELKEGQNGYKVLVVEFPDTAAEMPGQPVSTSPAGPNS